MKYVSTLTYGNEAKVEAHSGNLFCGRNRHWGIVAEPQLNWHVANQAGMENGLVVKNTQVFQRQLKRGHVPWLRELSAFLGKCTVFCCGVKLA